MVPSLPTQPEQGEALWQVLRHGETVTCLVHRPPLSSLGFPEKKGLDLRSVMQLGSESSEVALMFDIKDSILCVK